MIIINRLIILTILLFILFSLSNFFISIDKFITSNILIRQSFEWENKSNKKGSHSGSDLYRLYQINHIKDAIKFNFKDYLKFIDFNNFSDNHNFNNESDLINLLMEISHLKQKHIYAIYLDKNIELINNITCDTHASPFIIPAITNIVLINGLPNINKQSCYQNKNDYGYKSYYINDKKYNNKNLSNNEICEIIISNNLEKSIIINKNYNIYNYQIIDCIENS
tara:strand:- start:37310 stop:37978 length:669 start_codon:yes stop_codon:yes gene_type:complete